MRSILLALATCLLWASGASASPAFEPKVVLITLDGVRWQEIFRGADPQITADKRFVNPDIRQDVVDPAYVTVDDRGAALTPFLHELTAGQGVLVGDRDKGECAKLANDLWFSYPGYSEFLTGRPDPALVRNDKFPNPDVTFLEYLDGLPTFAGQVAAVGTWDVFPYIINTARALVPVNAGFKGAYPTDVRTAREGLKLLRSHKRALFIAFGDSDEFAHAGDYAHYLMAIERGDEFLREAWRLIQSDPYYRDQTTLIVTTDHGRGESPVEAWREHGSARAFQLNPTEAPQFNDTGAIGSDNVWIAALGPSVVKSAVSARQGVCFHSGQIAASALTALELDWKTFRPRPDGQSTLAPLSFIQK